MKPTMPQRKNERGQALIEMALTMPLLLLLSVGLYEFGRAFQHWQILTNATREGVRIAVLPGTSDDAVTSRVHAYMEAGRLASVGSATVTVVRDDEIPIGASVASASTVTVSYPFEFIVLQPIAQAQIGSLERHAIFGDTELRALQEISANSLNYAVDRHHATGGSWE